MQLSWLLLVSSTTLPSVLAAAGDSWSFTWRNASNDASSDGAPGAQACKEIDNPIGKKFEWEPFDGGWCVYLYENTDCTTPYVGHTCNDWPWPRESSYNLHSFEVTSNTSQIASQTPSAGATSNPTSTSNSNAGGSGNNTGGSGNGLSGGAIAGIVIGVVAGVVAIAVLLFFLCWRRRNTHSAVESSTQQDTSQPNTFAGKAELHEPQYPPATAIQELPTNPADPTTGRSEAMGDDGRVEVSGTHWVAEMDGSHAAQRT